MKLMTTALFLGMTSSLFASDDRDWGSLLSSATSTEGISRLFSSEDGFNPSRSNSYSRFPQNSVAAAVSSEDTLMQQALVDEAQELVAMGEPYQLSAQMDHFMQKMEVRQLKAYSEQDMIYVLEELSAIKI